ncbi:MAG: ABC transporter substrate-binding protein [Cyanothece sp. SIO2G6]|nr:ABC transporter substrate-binding protein [Cyanothece sp. SIO2G6]
MTQKNDAPVLAIALLLTLGLLGGGGWWLYRAFNLEVSPRDAATTVSSSPSASSSPASPLGSSNLPVLSQGEAILFPDGASVGKQQGVAAIASGDYSTAVSVLQASLQQTRNDPEALIYLNNAQIANQSAYTIAVVVPSPAAIDVAEELLRGVAHGQRDINLAGGIKGTPLRVAIATDNNDSEQARTIAQTLSDTPGIVGVIGHFSSDASLAAAEVYQAEDMVMISPTSTSVALAGAGDFIFRTVQSDRIAGDGLARHLLDSIGVTNVAVFHNSESAYSQSLKDAFSSAVLTGGGRVVSEIDLAAADFDAVQSVTQVIQQGAEALMLAANTSTRNQAVAVIQANQGQLALLGGDGLYNAGTLEQGQANAVDMVVGVAWHRDGVSAALFPKEAQSLWGGPVSWRTAMAYDAVQALIEAIRTTAQPADTLTAPMVQQALNNPNFAATGAAELVQFLPSGDRSLPPQLVMIAADPASQLGYTFVPVP